VDVAEVQPDDVCGEFEPDGRGKLNSGNAGTPGVVKSSLAVTGLLRRVVPVVAVAQMYITRVSEDEQTGVKRWFSSASGLDRDLYDERMSVELFKDFIKRVKSRDEVPAPFSSKAWNGGLPYLSIAHYLDLDGFGIAGDTEQVFVDGNMFKARGDFRDTEIGNASYGAVKRDIDDDLPHEFRTRISIAFLDLAHEHEGFENGKFTRENMIDQCKMCSKGLGEKIYRAGHLVHFALTRRPAFTRASISNEEPPDWNEPKES
jgi:hypothetical protein